MHSCSAASALTFDYCRWKNDWNRQGKSRVLAHTGPRLHNMQQGVQSNLPPNILQKRKKWKWSQPRLRCAGGKWSLQRRKMGVFTVALSFLWSFLSCKQRPKGRSVSIRRCSSLTMTLCHLLFKKLIDIYRNLLAASHEIYCRPIYPYAN